MRNIPLELMYVTLAPDFIALCREVLENIDGGSMYVYFAVCN